MELIWIWAIVVAISLVVEFATMQMVSIWIALGALVGLILSAIGGVALEIQIIVSCVVAMISIVFLRKFALKFLHKTKDTKPADSIIGRPCEVTKGISKETAGEVKLNGVLWTAISEDTLNVGEKAVVIETIGNKIKVKKGE